MKTKRLTTSIIIGDVLEIPLVLQELLVLIDTEEIKIEKIDANKSNILVLNKGLLTTLKKLDNKAKNKIPTDAPNTPYINS